LPCDYLLADKTGEAPLRVFYDTGVLIAFLDELPFKYSTYKIMFLCTLIEYQRLPDFCVGGLEILLSVFV